ncbi:ComEC/Rec2 family competence protein [Salinibacterium sp. ZJ70]|uniref:ComEC/Rec2 family competence protein n=1 Tax=Salinibacterium sp. ZJ70 TaxID=2708084 RepID=UPI00141E43C7|nr:ComEC/Rec2 family competence protein [Salinibacterium sp. ZJ70]
MPAALGAWASAGVVIGFPAEAPLGWVVGVLWAGAFVSAIVCGRWRLWLPVVLALTGAAIVAHSVAMRAPDRLPQALAEAASRGAVVELVAVITGQATDGRVTADVGLAQTTHPGWASSVVFLAEQEQGDSVQSEPQIGESWAVTARVVATEPADDATLLAFAERAGERLAHAPPILDAASHLRAGLRELAAGLPGRGAQLLPGLAVGDTSRVEDGLDADMKASSLSHLTAVSGANCAIVVGAVFALAAAMGAPRGARVVISLLALLGFVVLVTPEPSVLRASVMAAVVLVGLVSGRPMQGVPVLCLAIVGLLVVDPWLARSYGFALSVLATAGLLLLAAPLANVLARWMPRALALVLAVPLAAQLACQPVLILLSPSIATWGVLANVLAAPAAPMCTVIGLIACLVTPLAPALGGALAAIAWVPAAWIAAVAEFTAGLPGAQLPWAEGAAGLLSLAALTALTLTAFLAPPASRWRWAAARISLAAIVAVAATPAVSRIADVLSRPTDWQFALCDVGQGDALIVRSAQRVAVVDTGPDPVLVEECLARLAISHIDLLVLTHYDSDHVGGVEAVLGRVSTVLVGPMRDPEDVAVVDSLRASGAEVRTATDGLDGTLGSHSWTVLWPPSRGAESGNAASVALMVKPGPGCVDCLSALLLGDLGEEEQIRLGARHTVGPVDILKVAHHGSADSSAAITARAAARVALIGVGEGNTYGHPSPSALTALADSGTAVFRSDLHGLVLVGPSGVWTERG